MKPIHCLLGITLLTGCAQYAYNYQPRLTYPATSNDMQFSNDTFQVKFDLKSSGIAVTMNNNYSEGIKIKWEDVSFSVSGRTFTQSFSGYYSPADSILWASTPDFARQAVTIPPKSFFKFYLSPQYVSLDSNAATFGQHLFPESGITGTKRMNNVTNMNGKHVIVNLPVFIRDQMKPYYYDIVIDSVQVSKYFKESPSYF